MTTMYTYYQEVISEEHMLFAKELGEKYSISSQKVTHTIAKYCSESGIQCPRLFYKTKYGLTRVYPQAIYIPALQALSKISNFDR